MSAGEVRQYQVLPIQLTIKDQDDATINISAATAKKIRIRKPDNSVLEKDAAFVSDGADGKITYTTETTDLNQVGTYQLQAVVTLSSVAYPSDLETLEVMANLTN